MNDKKWMMLKTMSYDKKTDTGGCIVRGRDTEEAARIAIALDIITNDKCHVVGTVIPKRYLNKILITEAFRYISPKELATLYHNLNKEVN